MSLKPHPQQAHWMTAHRIAAFLAQCDDNPVMVIVNGVECPIADVTCSDEDNVLKVTLISGPEYREAMRRVVINTEPL